MMHKKMGGFRLRPASLSLVSAANISNFLAEQGLVVRRLAFKVDTAVVSSGAVVITVYKRPLPGSATGQVVLGTIVIPAGAVQGAVYYKDIAGVKFVAGDELAYDVTTAAAGGGAAGTGNPLLDCVEESPEEAANISTFVASA